MLYSPTFDATYNGLMSESLPGNIINANMRGFTTFFDNNTDADTVAQSVAAYYQNKRSVPDIIEVIPGETGQKDNTKTRADEDFDKIIEFYMRATPEQMSKVAEEAAKSEIPQSDKCESFSDENYFGIPFKSYCNATIELTKRSGLVIIGGVLLVIGLRYFLTR